MTQEEELEQKRLDVLCGHIDNVRRNCYKLGKRLIERGDIRLGRQLIANGYIHDNSKFYGIEWEHLHTDRMGGEHDALLTAAITNHVNTNLHHPEYWHGIHNMPTLYIAELVCDWAARSSEFGNDLREWIKDHATKKFNMTVQSKVYKEIKDLVDILLDPKFR